VKTSFLAQPSAKVLSGEGDPENLSKYEGGKFATRKELRAWMMIRHAEDLSLCEDNEGEK